MDATGHKRLGVFTRLGTTATSKDKIRDTTTNAGTVSAAQPEHFQFESRDLKTRMFRGHVS